MTDLNRLVVSLTKHNAHKVAELVHQLGATEALNHLNEVGADRPQALKNLSASQDGAVPSYWDEVRSLGLGATKSLMLVSIILSHHQLIDAMKGAEGKEKLSGRIDKGNQLDGKAFTNFRRIVSELGHMTASTEDRFDFSLKTIVESKELGLLTKKVLQSKLKAAAWNGKGDVVDEAIRLGLHRAFRTSERDFIDWLSEETSALTPEDEAFFDGVDAGESVGTFAFSPGHTPKALDPLQRAAQASVLAQRLHNEIQNGVYEVLVKKYGHDNVRTEQPTGSGTSIDVVAVEGGDATFFELKVAKTVTACIRQALPQLMEYAYWPNESRASKLVIVSTLVPSNHDKTYLRSLRERFSIPIWYQMFDQEDMSLGPLI